VAKIPFTKLYDNSYYTAYFTADNNQSVNPDLMEGKNNLTLIAI
jgi:hypothetical protein